MFSRDWLTSSRLFSSILKFPLHPWNLSDPSSKKMACSIHFFFFFFLFPNNTPNPSLTFQFSNELSRNSLYLAYLWNFSRQNPIDERIFVNDGIGCQPNESTSVIGTRPVMGVLEYRKHSRGGRCAATCSIDRSPKQRPPGPQRARIGAYASCIKNFSRVLRQSFLLSRFPFFFWIQFLVEII